MTTFAFSNYWSILYKLLTERNTMTSILIIDDDKLLRTMGKDMLTTKGYEVFTAENGEQGVTVLKSHDVGTVLLDLVLERESGLDLIPEIKATSPGSKIIMLTSDSSSESMERARELGASDYITKPVTVNKLLGLLDS
ncbi:MAG: response regulator [Deltaproteobacteria bacterium]|nr:response regulator [Deltaproteobacteria bacterium]